MNLSDLQAQCSHLRFTSVYADISSFCLQNLKKLKFCFAVKPIKKQTILVSKFLTVNYKTIKKSHLKLAVALCLALSQLYQVKNHYFE